MENLADSRLLPQRCNVSDPSCFCAARLQRPRGHCQLSASALKRSVCGLGNEVPCIIDPEILFGRGQQLSWTLHPMTSPKSPSQEPQTASKYPCYSFDDDERNHNYADVASATTGSTTFNENSQHDYTVGTTSSILLLLLLLVFLSLFLSSCLLSSFLPLSSVLPFFRSSFLCCFLSSFASLVLSFCLCFFGRKPENIQNNPEK